MFIPTQFECSFIIHSNTQNTKTIRQMLCRWHFFIMYSTWQNESLFHKRNPNFWDNWFLQRLNFFIDTCLLTIGIHLQLRNFLHLLKCRNKNKFKYNVHVSICKFGSCSYKLSNKNERLRQDYFVHLQREKGTH